MASYGKETDPELKIRRVVVIRPKVSNVAPSSSLGMRETNSDKSTHGLKIQVGVHEAFDKSAGGWGEGILGL